MTTFEKFISLFLIIDFTLISLQYIKDKKLENEMRIRAINEERLNRVIDGAKILNTISETELN